MRIRPRAERRQQLMEEPEMDQFAAYGHAVVSVAVYAVIANVLNAAVGITKGSANLAPGGDFDPADYSNANWRLDRTYQNTIEMGGFYFAVVFAAILAGASPFWINLLASIGLLTRLGMIFVYLRGIGKAYGGLRTRLAIIASLANLAMAILAVVAVF
jgi:uncharacterized MAPEG superfamily protein